MLPVRLQTLLHLVPFSNSTATIILHPGNHTAISTRPINVQQVSPVLATPGKRQPGPGLQPQVNAGDLWGVPTETSETKRVMHGDEEETCLIRVAAGRRGASWK